LFESHITVDLYETRFPGKLAGKEVIDPDARRLGIVKCLRIRMSPSPLRLFLVVRNKDIDIEVPFEYVEKIGKNIIKLRRKVDVEEVSVDEALKIIEDIKSEILMEFQILMESENKENVSTINV